MGPYFARSFDEDPDPSPRWQLLGPHLLAVAALACEFARLAKPGDETFAIQAWQAGLLHDLGKFHPDWQAYLRLSAAGRRTRPVPHSLYGAAAAYRAEAISAAFAIAAHHAGLGDGLNAIESIAKDCDAETLAKLERLASQEIVDWSAINRDAFALDTADDCRELEFRTRMLLSILVDADRTDSARHNRIVRGEAWPNPISLDADSMLGLLKAHCDRISSQAPADALNITRRGIFKASLDAGERLNPGFFSLTVPTGGGKTLSAMAFALSHAKANRLRRVIVVIPYLSIIEQNATVYRTIFGEKQVLEHHSGVDPGKLEVDPAQASLVELAAENWEAPIVVTTGVQFIESLFADSPRKTRKLHNVARSVVIFDEAQAIPVHLLEPTFDVLRELVSRWGMSCVLSSATYPAFRRVPGRFEQGLAADEAREIAPEPATLFRDLRRVDYHLEHNEKPLTWPEVADRLARHDQSLCVVNTRRHARELWECLRGQYGSSEAGDGIFHLSTSMCAQHRLDVLGISKSPPENNIRERLRQGKRCRLISTQLIEAGVDVDFPVVYRALGPLDSIAQVSGRCNREGLLKDEKGRPIRGKVYVFQPADGSLPSTRYASAINQAKEYINNPDRLAEDPALFAGYFSKLIDTQEVDRLQSLRANLNYPDVAKHAKVIPDDGQKAIVAPYGKAKEIVEEVQRSGRFEQSTLRRLQRFIVNVRPMDFSRLWQAGALSPLLKGRVEDLAVLDASMGFYRVETGVDVVGHAPEDLVV